MNEKIKYSEQWDISAQYFYNKGYYSWMADKLTGYKNVLEVGCGTGYSTLALVEKGYRVIVVEKNPECINKAKKLLYENGYKRGEGSFITGDIVDEALRNKLVKKFKFDITICWNIGTYWNRQMMEKYLPYMYEYGLDSLAISSNPESAYAELIIWNACRLAKAKEVPCNIVERGSQLITAQTDPFYYVLKNELGFSSIEYDNKPADSLSNGGRMLTVNGKINAEEKVEIVFASILYK